MKGFSPVFAVIRIDTPVFLAKQMELANDLLYRRQADANCELLNFITIKEIVYDRDKALAEVKRLNDLNGDKGCIYYCQQTRLEPEDHLPLRERVHNIRNVLNGLTLKLELESFGEGHE